MAYPLSKRVKDATKEHHSESFLFVIGHTVAPIAAAAVIVAAALVVVGQHLKTKDTSQINRFLGLDNYT